MKFTGKIGLEDLVLVHHDLDVDGEEGRIVSEVGAVAPVEVDDGHVEAGAAAAATIDAGAGQTAEADPRCSQAAVLVLQFALQRLARHRVVVAVAVNLQS